MLRIRLLNSFEASINEEAPKGFGPQGGRLLIYLALHANQWVEKQVIYRDLQTVKWSNGRKTVSDLTDHAFRQQLHRLGEALDTEAGRLESVTGLVRLRLDEADVDVLRFQSLVAQGGQEAWDQARQLYQGDLLKQDQAKSDYWREEWEPWITPFREKLHRRYEQTLQKLSEMSVARSPLPLVELPGNSVPLESPFYIARSQDEELFSYLTGGGQTLLIKGARQTGKTSLLNRVHHHSQESGKRVVYSDCLNLPLSCLDNETLFFFALAGEFARQLQLENLSDEAFDDRQAPSTNFDCYIRDEVLADTDTPLVWIIDEADRLFPCAFRDDFFGKLRAWHNERSRISSPLRRLTIVLAYSTEAHLFIRDPNMSPFNVGSPFALSDLTSQETAELNRRHGHPLGSREELLRLQTLTGGHPYLIRLCLYNLSRQKFSLAQIEAEAAQSNGIFASHLEHLGTTLAKDAELEAVVRQFVREGVSPSVRDFSRLCSAGLMTGANPNEMRPRCALYKIFLKRHLS